MKKTASVKRISAAAAVLLVSLLTVFIMPFQASAAALDEILVYSIRADINDDATVFFNCHIEWKVLDSESEGPLSWVKIGIPNDHCSSVQALSDNISSIGYYSDYGSFIRVDFDREYFKDEVISFDFSFVQDYLYQMNYLTEGETVYQFTPGWFDGIDVDSFSLKWNSRGATSMSPSCTVDSAGYYTWESSLSDGEKLTVSVTYPNDAFAFDETKTIDTGDQDYGGADFGSIALGIISSLFTFGFFITVFLVIIALLSKGVFSRTSSFSGETTKKVTREKIVYYPACQGCGAPRPEGKENCEYCGRSFVKSRETVTEEEIPEDMKKHTTDGDYRYSTDPNTFMRVHVVPVVLPRFSSSSKRCVRSLKVSSPVVMSPCRSRWRRICSMSSRWTQGCAASFPPCQQPRQPWSFILES